MDQHHPQGIYYELGDSSGSGSSVVPSATSSSRGMRSGSTGGAGAQLGGVGINCQDCGNQAKKDCAHLRCRTCCKSRGLDCPTHVKSTWVPAPKRREQQQLAAMLQHQRNPNQQPSPSQQQLDDVRGGGGAGGGQKRLREFNRSINVNVAATRSVAAATTTSAAGHDQVGPTFPAEVSLPALFRCVRLSSIDDAEKHLAYQTAVGIAGHVFKGILYDQGPEGPYNSGEGGSGENPLASSGLQHHNLLNCIGTASAGSQQEDGSQLIDPASAAMYPTPIDPFLAGTQFSHPRHLDMHQD
ncbi:hypothetical protein Dimus_002676 [Dionaea muscipula]